MQAKDAIPILEKSVAKLESLEPSWKNCKACPHGGKCCVGATGLLVFPEEKRDITDFLQRNDRIKQFALKKYRQGQGCYFHDSNAKSCLIHEVRPLNCRWTPYNVWPPAQPGHTFNGMVRDDKCDFIPITANDKQRVVNDEIVQIENPLSPNANTQYICLHGIKEIHPLLARSEELSTLEELLQQL